MVDTCSERNGGQHIAAQNGHLEVLCALLDWYVLGAAHQSFASVEAVICHKFKVAQHTIQCTPGCPHVGPVYGVLAMTKWDLGPLYKGFVNDKMGFRPGI